MRPISPIGVVRSPRAEPFEDNWGDVLSRIEFDADVLEPTATLGLDDYSHLVVVFSFHKAVRVCRGTQHPRNNPSWPEAGILAQRAANRPNHIGVTACALEAVEGLTVTVRGLDAVDGTPVLDVKPYLPEFAPRGEVRVPWWSRDLMREYF